MASDLSSVVSFNVGGHNFTTLRETLLKEGNSRLALIARGLLVTARDPISGAFVIDRDPKYFQLVLNWLRDGWCLLPKSAEERRELLQEVRYYQLTGFEGWLRTQELLAETGAPQAQDHLVVESPRPRTHLTGLHAHAHTGYNSFTAYQGYSSPSSAQHPIPTSPRVAATTFLTTGRGVSSPWTPQDAATATAASLSAGPSTAPAAAVGPPPSATNHYFHTQQQGHLQPAGPPPLNYGQPQLQHQHQYQHRPDQQPGPGPSALAAGSPSRSSPPMTNGGAAAGTAAWGGGGGAEGAVGAIASLRMAFLAATAPPRPAQPVAPYSLQVAADDSSSWTSKYLKGNNALRELVNTLLELAFLAPHRILHSGKTHISISVACSHHGHEANRAAAGSQDDQLRNKLLEVRVRGALGWAFDLTLRPSSDIALWDKYGGVAAGVQDNWFVLGAILKDQFGVVLEEDAAARPSCVACRRTCLAVTLNKIY